MLIAFRTDAALELGHGHVIRCLTLANALQRRGAVVSFVCRENTGHLCDLVEKRGFPVTRLHSRWGSLERDAAALNEDDARCASEAIRQLGRPPDWLIVDHYGLNEIWERAMRPWVRRIMVIDDLANRMHDCDLLLDQNLYDQPGMRYEGKLPSHCATLLGPQYALLQPEYAGLHSRVTPRQGPVQRILIFFGGTDPDNLTGVAVAACLDCASRNMEIELVTTSANSHVAKLVEQVRNRANVTVHMDLQTLGPLMARADLTIGAAGTATWERLCVGLPALVVTIAENQRAVAAELHRRGLIRWIGHKDEVGEAVLSVALSDLLAQGLDASWSRRCLATVDGLGCERVCALLLASDSTPLTVRAVSKEDEELLLGWANDPITRRNGLRPELIAVETHRAWLEQRLRQPDECHFYIVETPERIPIGQVRFQREGAGWEVHFAVAPLFRGRGLGRAALACALSRLRADVPGTAIFGRVKRENLASRRIFESLGFVLDDPTSEPTVVFRAQL